MKKYAFTFSSIAVIVLFLGMALLNMACEGPAGADGLAGKDGKDGNGTCVTCHSASAADVNLKFAQYSLSQHNRGIVYEEEAGRIQCGGCHSGDGFAEAAALGQDDAKTLAASKINCKACHTIHKDYAMTDFGLRITSGFDLRHSGFNADGTAKDSVTIDLGKGNLCAKCHQARNYSRSLFDSLGTKYENVSPAGAGRTYSRLGPHYGTPTNVFTMNGPIQIAGSTAYPTSNPHMTVPNGCVSCHMGTDAANPAVGGHSFLMPVANLSTITTCQTCHDAAKIKSGGLTKQVADDIAIYRQKLIDRGWLDISQAVNEEFPKMAVLGEYVATPGGIKRTDLKKSDVDVIMNYLYVAKDRSNGVHNPGYVKALVANGLEYLNK